MADNNGKWLDKFLPIIGHLVTILTVILTAYFSNISWNDRFHRERNTKVIDRIYEKYSEFEEKTWECLVAEIQEEIYGEFILIYDELEKRSELDKIGKIAEFSDSKWVHIAMMYVTQKDAKLYLMNEHDKYDNECVSCMIKIYADADYVSLYIKGDTISKTLNMLKVFNKAAEVSKKPDYLRIKDTNMMLQAFSRSLEKKIEEYGKTLGAVNEYFDILHKQMDELSV